MGLPSSFPRHIQNATVWAGLVAFRLREMRGARERGLARALTLRADMTARRKREIEVVT